MRTVWPRMALPSATPALTVTTLRTLAESAGRPATDTVFSWPVSVPMHAWEVGASDHTLAVASHDPLTSHGVAGEALGEALAGGSRHGARQMCGKCQSCVNNVCTLRGQCVQMVCRMSQ